MSCEELQELYELYALGAVDPAERQQIEEHLAQDCAACKTEFARAQRVAALLALSTPVAGPPKRLRDRVLALAAPQSERRTSVTWLTHAWATLAILMLAAVIWYSYSRRALTAEVAALQRKLAQVEAQNAELAARNQVLLTALELVHLPDARQVTFGRPDREPPRGRIWVHPQRGVLLLASHLTPAPPGKAYEMWIIPKGKGAAPIPAGLFNSDQRGEATHVWPQPVNPDATAAIAVTLEPAGGVPAPTSTPIIVAGL
jgi:anti-sigma-K factor RskA